MCNGCLFFSGISWAQDGKVHQFQCPEDAPRIGWSGVTASKGRMWAVSKSVPRWCWLAVPLHGSLRLWSWKPVKTHHFWMFYQTVLFQQAFQSLGFGNCSPESPALAGELSPVSKFSWLAGRISLGPHGTPQWFSKPSWWPAMNPQGNRSYILHRKSRAAADWCLELRTATLPAVNLSVLPL